MKHFSYSQHEFNKAVEFLSKNNKYFLGQSKLIASKLLDTINMLTTDESDWLATMGFTLFKTLEAEDNGVESWWIDILVSPAVSDNEDYLDDIVLIAVIDAPPTLKNLEEESVESNELLDLVNDNVELDPSKLN